MKRPSYIYVVRPEIVQIEKRRIKKSERVVRMEGEPGRWRLGPDLFSTNGWEAFQLAKAWLVAWQKEHYQRARASYLKAIKIKSARGRVSA